MSFRSFGKVRANSRAVARPMPDEAPVMRMVFPARRADMAELDILREKWGIGGWSVGGERKGVRWPRGS